MVFTAQQIANDAGVLLRDPAGVNWPSATMISIMQEGIRLIRQILQRENPDFWSAPFTVDLTAASANGPYAVPNDFSYLVSIQDINKTDLNPVRRESVDPTVASGPPRGYWIEGYEENSKIFFDMTPDQDYTYPGRYMPKLVNIVNIGDNVPLPDFAYDVLKTWTVKVAFQMDEYLTMDEDQKLGILMPILRRMGLVDSAPMVAAFEQGYF